MVMPLSLTTRQSNPILTAYVRPSPFLVFAINQQFILIYFPFFISISMEEAAYEWASAIAAFVRTSYVRGHKIVTLGHSAGAAAV